MTMVSMMSDEWTNEQVEVVEAVDGNTFANLVYKKCTPFGGGKHN